MNTSDFKETAERYKKEMIDLYGAKSTTVPDAASEKTEEINNKGNEENQEENTESIQESKNESTENNIEERFPSPVIPDFIKSAQKTPKNDSFGYLKVSVRTGNGGIPIENSAVTVSETVNGKENIIKLMLTNSSGDTETIKLPAPKKPDGNQPQDYEHFSTYNISAFSEGYFREVSRDAPIFEGITSIQTFFLVPEPYNYDSNADTLNYQNEEPII